MLAINIGLVVLGVIIPIIMVIFWSKAGKMLEHEFEKSGSIILDRSTFYGIVKWLYTHRSKFHVMIGAIVTVIEFLALIPF